MEALLSEADCQPIFHPQPWKRALNLIKSGKMDAITNLSRTEERGTYMYFIGPMRDEVVSLIVPSDSNYEINSLDDLKKLPGPVGKVNGAYHGKLLQEKLENDPSFSSNIHPVTDSSQLAPMLKKGRMVAFMMNSDDFAYKLKTDPHFNGLKRHDFPISTSSLYFGFSKVSVSNELHSKLQQAYEAASSKGDFTKIIDRYN